MSTISAGTTTTTALVQTGDTTGNLVLATGSVPTTALTLSSTQNATFANTVNLPNTFGFKNRIINGGMTIDQRNAGASVTQTAALTYSLDRWRIFGSSTSKFTVQQNAGSVTPPTGFTNYLGVTSSSAYTVGSGETYRVEQPIEGYNLADLGWGTANAKTITISFWVRSSLTGTFGGALWNVDATRAYPFSYTISSANTWEQKTVTIVGDTTGTWNTTNSSGLVLQFSMGAGSTYLGTAGSWGGTFYTGVTGQTNIVATNGATFYITGVQLEVGSQATSFDYRDYGRELIMCQRYYQVLGKGGSSGNQTIANGFYGGAGTAQSCIPLQVTMRTTPSFSATSGTSYYNFYRTGSINYLNSLSFDSGSPNSVAVFNNSEASATSGVAGLLYIQNGSTSSFLAASAEL